MAHYTKSMHILLFACLSFQLTASFNPETINYYTLQSDILCGKVVPFYVDDMKKVFEEQRAHRQQMNIRDQEGEKAFNLRDMKNANIIALELIALEKQEKKIVEKLILPIKSINTLRCVSKNLNGFITNNAALLSRYARSLALLNKDKKDNKGFKEYYYRWNNLFMRVAQTLIHKGTVFYSFDEVLTSVDDDCHQKNKNKCLVDIFRCLTCNCCPYYKKILCDGCLEKINVFRTILRDDTSFGYALLKKLLNSYLPQELLDHTRDLNASDLMAQPFFSIMTYSREHTSITSNGSSAASIAIVKFLSKNLNYNNIVTIHFDPNFIKNIDGNDEQENIFVQSVYDTLSADNSFENVYFFFPYCDSTPIAKKIYTLFETKIATVGISYSLRPPIWL